MNDKDDVEALIDTVARECHLTAKENLIPELLAEIARVEPTIPAADLDVTIFRTNNQVKLAIRNNGNRPLEMVDAELLLPKLLCTNLNDGAHPTRVRIYDEIEGIPMIGYRLTTQQSPIAHLGVDPLRHFLDQSSGDVVLNELTLPINKPITEADKALPVRYRVCAKTGSVANTSKLGDLLLQ